MTKSEMIDNIMDNFDFSRVAKCMEVLQWKWCGVEGVPQEPDIRKSARKLLNGVKEELTNDRCSFSIGGFVVTAWYDGGKLDAMELSFVVADWDVGML